MRNHIAGRVRTRSGFFVASALFLKGQVDSGEEISSQILFIFLLLSTALLTQGCYLEFSQAGTSEQFVGASSVFSSQFLLQRVNEALAPIVTFLLANFILHLHRCTAVHHLPSVCSLTLGITPLTQQEGFPREFAGRGYCPRKDTQKAWGYPEGGR